MLAKCNIRALYAGWPDDDYAKSAGNCWKLERWIQYRQVVVLRRTEDWQLVATMLDLRDAVLGRQMCPASEIWVSDSDLIIVPQSKIQLCNKWVEQLFTKGIYGVVPLSGSVSYSNGTTL